MSEQPPVYDPKIAALATQPWFLEAHAAIEQAVQALRSKGVKGTLGFSGATLRLT